MRKDAKVGMALALIIVVVAGWYYTRDDSDRDTIALAPATDNAELGVLASDEPIQAPAHTQPSIRPPAPAHAQPHARSAVSPAPTMALTAERSEPDTDATSAGGSTIDTDDLEVEALTAPGAAGERIPTPAGALEPLEYYIIQPGDTLARLAEIYYGDRELAELIQRANPSIRDPQRLTVGVELRLPAVPSERAAPRATAGAPAPTPAVAQPQPQPQPAAAATAASAAPAARTYVARSGDSFYAIAKSILGDGSRWPELVELNKELVKGDPRRLKPGMTLRLPPE